LQLPSANAGPYGNGSLRDIVSWDVSSFLTPGLNTLEMTSGVASDCLALVVALVDLPVGAAPDQPVTEVEIDIKPGSDPISIKLNDQGNARIAVAILGTETRNAADIDVASLTLGNEDGDDTPVATRNHGTLRAGMEDVNNDGRRDLVVHFERAALMARGDLTTSTTELVLLGKLTDGTAIRGVDAVRVIP
jgi:hypothetical protein